eukprot:GEZU01042273.1.p1 GENE.GEZU01042273.1~~GEZU01042273.1.p1  ORF type:complete len:277 (+),score=60.46 GEZU01042273.1:546-1376(+)
MIHPSIHPSFGQLHADCLAKTVSEDLNNASHLDVAYKFEGGFTKGTMVSVFDDIARGNFGLSRVNGAVQKDRFFKARTVMFDMKTEHTCVSFPIQGDLATAYRTTRIPNITVYTALPFGLSRILSPMVAAAMFTMLSWAMWLIFMFPFTLWMARRLIDLGWMMMTTMRGGRKGPSEATLKASTAFAYAEVRNNEGESVKMSVHTPQAYLFTVDSALRAADTLVRMNEDKKRAIGGDRKHMGGVFTPSIAFGADFLRHCSHVRVSPEMLTIKKTKSG